MSIVDRRVSGEGQRRTLSEEPDLLSRSAMYASAGYCSRPNGVGYSTSPDGYRADGRSGRDATGLRAGQDKM